MPKLTGVFQINDWQETTKQQIDDKLKCNLASVKLTYTGDIKGTSELQYLLQYQQDGSANFVGFETIDAELDDGSGLIVLRHLGQFKQGVASSEFEVIQSTLSVDLVGLKGKFESGENGQAEYVIQS
ncbi:DUF3224 domain-containing protein [Paraglaciecola sp. 2405UD69-4]|uniref:DUF3224 domain-containing protein n=1 Tax=Paraglaciecola sp. 2405UD69-4 TaxID=3391836 RepID=UPI0039C94D28